MTAPRDGELILETVGPRRVNELEWLFTDTGLETGQTVDTGLVEATVEAADAKFPSRVHFTLPPKSCILTWKNGVLRGDRPPPIGETVAIDYEPGPMGL